MDAIAHHVVGDNPRYFPVCVETSSRSNISIYTFFKGTTNSPVRIGDKNIFSNFQRLTLRITARRPFPLFQSVLGSPSSKSFFVLASASPIGLTHDEH